MTRNYKIIYVLVIAPMAAIGQVPDTLKAYEASQKADALYQVSDLDSAKFWFDRSADLWEEATKGTQDSLLWARALDCRYYAGLCDYIMDRLPAAEKSLARTLAQVYEIWPSNPVLEAQYYEYQGLIFIKKRMLDSAYYCIRQGLELKKQVFDEFSLQLAENYSMLGGLEVQRGNRENALELNLKVLDIQSAHLPPFDADFARTYNNLGYVYSALGATDFALENFLQAVEIRRHNGTDQGYRFALVLGNIGNMYKEIGDYQQALAYHYKELNIKKATLPHNHRSLARNYNNLAKTNFELGDYDLALEYALKSLEIFEVTLEDHDDILVATRNEVGRALAKKDRFEEALPYFNKNIRFASTSGAFVKVARTHNYIAEGYLEMDDYTKALHHHEASLNILIETYDNKKHPEIAGGYLRIGQFYQRIGETDKSLENLQKALVFNLANFDALDPWDHPHKKDTVFDRMLYLQVLSEKGEILGKIGNNDRKHLHAADTTWQLATRLIHNLRIDYHNESSKLELLDKSRKVYENHLHTLYHLYAQTQDPRYLERAFNTTEQTKATLLHEGIKAVKARNFGGVPKEVIRLEQNLRIKLAYNEKRIFDMENSPEPADPQDILAIKARYFDHKVSYDSLIRLLEEKYPGYHHLKYKKDVNSTSDIQGRLAPRTAVVEYMLTDSLLYIFKITNSNFNMERVILPTGFENDLFAFIQGLRDRTSAIAWREDEYAQYRKTAYSLYQTLLAPVLGNEGEVEKLIIVPDGMLSYLPFECLVTGNDMASPYLIKNINTRYAYSASLMVEEDLTGKVTAENFIGFGPQYSEGSVFASARGLELLDSATRAALAPLKFNQEEVKYIADLLSGRAITGSQVSENTFRELAPRAKILHLAMHALIHDENPRYSGFLFSSAQNNIPGQVDSIRYESDNFLHAFELYNMQLNSELAVLSACETGFGKLQRGEGIMSLSRAFRYSGSPNLVMSLWQADDEATYDLMKAFYRGINQGLPKDEALRKAKINYLDTHDRTHPYFWANFVLIGDDKPVGVDSGMPTYLWYTIAGVVFLLLLSIYLQRRRSSEPAV